MRHTRTQHTQTTPKQELVRFIEEKTGRRLMSSSQSTAELLQLLDQLCVITPR